MKYSKSTGCFYPSDIEYRDPPTDLIEVSADGYAVAAARTLGETIDVANGKLVILAPVPPTLVELRVQTVAQARAKRLPVMGVLDGLQSSANALGDQARATVLEVAKQGLRDITKVDISACADAAAMRLVVMNRYKAIAATLPADARTAFAQALL